MIKIICSNARSIKTDGALERLQNLKKIHNMSVIAILEPFAINELNFICIKFIEIVTINYGYFGRVVRTVMC